MIFVNLFIFFTGSETYLDASRERSGEQNITTLAQAINYFNYFRPYQESCTEDPSSAQKSRQQHLYLPCTSGAHHPERVTYLFRATAFSQVRLFLDTPFPPKITVSGYLRIEIWVNKKWRPNAVVFASVFRFPLVVFHHSRGGAEDSRPRLFEKWITLSTG